MHKPNWENISDYPDPKTASLDRWAFEFLWRNEKFRQEFERAADEQKSLKQAGSLSIFWNQAPVGKVIQKWGLTPLLPEWGLDTPARFERYPILVPCCEINGKQVHLAYESPSRAILEFDLSAPIGPQIQRARHNLKMQQKHYRGPKRDSGRSQIRLYRNYLRVLDAMEAKTSKSQMLKVFAFEDDRVGEDSIRNWILEATRLRDGGYLEIITNPLP